MIPFSLILLGHSSSQGILSVRATILNCNHFRMILNPKTRMFIWFVAKTTDELFLVQSSWTENSYLHGNMLLRFLNLG